MGDRGERKKWDRRRPENGRTRVDFTSFHFLMFDSAGAWTMRRRISGAIDATSQHSSVAKVAAFSSDPSFIYPLLAASSSLKGPPAFVDSSPTDEDKRRKYHQCPFRTADSLPCSAVVLYFAWLFAIRRSAAPSVVRQRELSKAARQTKKWKRKSGESTQIHLFSIAVVSSRFPF